jgi:AraC-like DNA-binding protein
MSDCDSKTFQSHFFQKAPLAESLCQLFDSLPQTYFYAKDHESRFVKVSPLFLENHGLTSETEAIGKTDYDFHPPLMAGAYIDEDRRVMASKRMLTGQVWLVLHRRSTPRWYVSTKTPLLDVAGKCIGIAGAMYRIEQPKELAHYFQELLPAVRHIEKGYSESISMAAMAELAGISPTHFNRRFRQLLRMTPTHYLRRVRVQSAQQLLTTTSRPLADIALAVGYTDQSYFTKQFRAVTGMTPSAYRLRFLNS